VFTHHTLYAKYTHYVPADSPALNRFVIALATQFANQSDLVFTPSESIADLLTRRGVTTPTAVVPTGVDLKQFTHGDGTVFRRRMNIPDDVYVVGHLGRLAEEKNLGFLANAVSKFMHDQPNTYFLLCGAGPMEAVIKALFAEQGLIDRLRVTAVYDQTQLKHAYSAMDVFAFSSKSETQGMVLTEAMAAGVPVIALNASGAREVVNNQVNGLLLNEENIQQFTQALQWMLKLNTSQRRNFRRQALKTAQQFSMQTTASTALSQYQKLVTQYNSSHSDDTDSEWDAIVARLKAEWDIIDSFAQATTAAFSDEKQAVLE